MTAKKKVAKKKATKKKAPTVKVEAKTEPVAMTMIPRELVVAAAAPIYAFLRYGVQPMNMNRNDMHEAAVRQAFELVITVDTISQELLEKAVENIKKLHEERQRELEEKAGRSG